MPIRSAVRPQDTGSKPSITCPICNSGTIRWAEAGYVPAYRICDVCHRHFLGGGNAAAPTLMRMGGRKGWPYLRS